MKLRMETGNFNIVLDENNKAYLPNGMSAIDFIGAVIVTTDSVDGTTYEAVTKATDLPATDEEPAAVKVGSNMLYYPDTGVLEPIE